MKRWVTGLLALSAVLAAPAHASAPSAELTGFSCDSPARQISVTAVMRPRKGTQHMELKFALLRKAGRSRFQIVRGKGLDTWIHPTPPDLGQRAGDMWTYTKPVLDLSAPAVYRFKVTFRWELERSRVDTVLSSASCSQT